jgi:CheY-like chemotaxis protein
MRVRGPAARLALLEHVRPTARPTRVVTVEDDARYRATIEVLLGHSEDFVLAGSHCSASAAFTSLSDSVEAGDPPGWDLVLMDLEVPGMSGVECTRRIRGH